MIQQHTNTPVYEADVGKLQRNSPPTRTAPQAEPSAADDAKRRPQRRRHPLIRLFGSVRFGIALMAIILVYASLASALPQVRGALEMTEMQIFRHWIFVALCVLLAISLTVATITRIKFNWINAGVLTVHTGLLLLIGGSIYYFGTKIEGDVVLRSPRVEVVANISGDERVIAAILADTESTWQTFMPAFGGDVSLSVTSAEHDDTGALQRCAIEARMGNGAVQPIELTANGEAASLDGDRLQARLVAYPAVDQFYDNETPTLYVREAGSSEAVDLPVHGLPIYRERYLDEGYDLQDRDGDVVPSKRSSPHVALAGFEIPTKGLEHWCLPIKLSDERLPFDMTITGFVPYIADMKKVAVGGGNEDNPAINLELSAGGMSRVFSLFANSPKDSLIPSSIPIEFRVVDSVAEREALFANLVGPHELTVEVKEPPAKKTFAIRAGDVLPIDGTSYQLTIKNVMPSWPLMTPGFENAVSPMASVDVTNGELNYNRTVIQRFPHLSQDIDEAGVRHREGPYDPNLVLNYRSSANGWMMVVAVPDEPAMLGVFDATGRVHRFELPVGQTQTITVGLTQLDLRLADYFPKGRYMQTPVIEPLERRRPNIAARSMSSIRIAFTGRGELDGWQESRWCLFSQYPHVDARPMSFATPDGRNWELIYSRLAHDLGVDIAARKLSVTYFPGRQNVESWRSDFVVMDGPNAEPNPGMVYTNETCKAGAWTLFQSGAAKDNWSYTILGVGNRNGIIPMVLGCVLITIGCWYAFYVKPILKKRRQTAAA